MTKIVINTQFGGFGLSDEAYEWLIAHGVRVARYIKQKRDPETMRYLIEPENEGEIIFDRTLIPYDEMDELDKLTARDDYRILGRYWEKFIRNDRRDWPLLIQCIEELGEKANGNHATLKIVEIPDDIKWEIDEYDGNETIEEKHRSWS